MNRFLILSRDNGHRARRLSDVLSPLGAVVPLPDRPGVGGVWIPNEEAERYPGLCDPSIPRLNAWSRALAHVAAGPFDGWTWFVEDDVAGDRASFVRLLDALAQRGTPYDLVAMASNVCRPEDRDKWPWTTGPDSYTHRTFNPMCRMSPKLLWALCSVPVERMAFLEVLFASVCENTGGSFCDMYHLCPEAFGEFRHRPGVVRGKGISHPVKDNTRHKLLCFPVNPHRHPTLYRVE